MEFSWALVPWFKDGPFGYHQVIVSPCSCKKLAFAGSDATKYTFKVMPFGLTNAPATFNCLMTDLFWTELDDVVLVFFDNILVYSRSIEEYEWHPWHTLEILRKAKLYAKRSKCTFFTNKVAYLGFIVSKEGLSLDPTKVEVVVKWPIPKNITKVWGFLGLTGWYQVFVKNYACIVGPLTKLTKKIATR